MKFSALLAAGLLSVSVAAHPQHHTRAELQRKSTLSKRCESAAGQFNKKRHAKRMLKRSSELAERSGNTTFEITTEAPYYDSIQNDTCVLTPEVTQGPYVWPQSETLRQDMTEGQPGVPLWLDIGVLNTETCEPFPNILLNFWHCNATGSYSSFTGISPNVAFPDYLDEHNLTDTFEIGVTDIHTDNTTFLRGLWPTDSEGVMEMKTIFPGFYSERAIHIHVEAFTDWVLRENGTIASSNRVSTGQLYFAEDLSEQIMALEPYVSHTEIVRLTNSEDDIFPDSQVNGYNPIVSIIPADGENIENGVIGYITIGVDPTLIETGDAGF